MPYAYGPEWYETNLRQRETMTAPQKEPAGSEREAPKHWCETCEGTGSVYQEHQAGCHVGGDYPCPDCDGKGYWIPRASQPSGAAGEALRLILPMAKGYAAEHWVGSNAAYIAEAEAVLASLASPSSGGWQWVPTAENINALPKPVRDYIHGLAANCDPSGMVRENTQLRDMNVGLQKMYRAASDALAEVRGCFEAAEGEGLALALAETTDERLKDLVERRLMYAMHAAAPKSGDKSHE